jgi:hypothetical protein
MALVIKGSSSGQVTVDVPASAGTNTLTLPASTQTVGTVGPTFSAYQSSAQSGISHQTWTKVTLTTENFDTDSKFASSRFTPTVAGYYQLSGAVQTPSVTVAHFICGAIYKNGANVFQFTLSNAGSGFYPISTGSTVLYLDSDDYVELYVFGNKGGGDITLQTGSNATHFEGAFIRS